MNLHEFYMKQALKQAAIAFEKDEVPVGCIIVYKSQIIGRAYNQIKLLKDPTAHAEMIAITQAASFLKNERLTDCAMYVTVEPCPMCVGAMVLARIKHLIIGASDPKTGACGGAMNLIQHSKLNHKIKVTFGIMQNESSLFMKEFFRKKREKVGK